MRRLNVEKDSSHRDFIWYILQQREKHDLKDDEIVMNGALFIVAGRFHLPLPNFQEKANPLTKVGRLRNDSKSPLRPHLKTNLEPFKIQKTSLRTANIDNPRG